MLHNRRLQRLRQIPSLPKTIEKPLMPMVLTKRNITIPSFPKNDHCLPLISVNLQRTQMNFERLRQKDRKTERQIIAPIA